MLGTPGTRMEAFKKSALDFVTKRPGDAIGLVVFSTNGYLVSPANFDHESMTQYLLMTGTQTLVNEGYTGIGEGLGTANRFFEQQRETAGREVRGQVMAARGNRSEAVLFLRKEADTYGKTSIIDRINKNINLISLEGERAFELGATESLAGTPVSPPA